jgi:predicted O-methyltransferase YrrM
MIPLRLLPPARRRSGVISVTVPSRGRVIKLSDSIRSLRDTADRPELLEILVAYDPDNPGTGHAARDLGADVIWEAPERYGYARSAHYWAELMNRSSGEWILATWSDDAIMKTTGWDDKLRAQPAGSIAFLDGNYPGLTCFPALHADALGAIGRVAPLPALDTWFEYAGRDSGVLSYPGIYVHQDRPDLTGCAPDTTHSEGGGAWRAGAGGTVNQPFYQQPYATWRYQDTQAVRLLRGLEEGYAARLVPWSDIQEQMPLLRDAARRYTRPVIAELGTRTGESTSALLAGAAASGGHVWSVDIGPSTGEWSHTGMWSFLSADDMSTEASAFIPAELDVLFIDTSHRYEHTLAELRLYGPRVRPGGTILMHDVELSIGQMIAYGEPGAREDAGGPEHPVDEAIRVYCAENNLTWARQTDRPAPAEGRPFFGLGTIAVPGGDQ